jgi:hypothetical protein
MSRQASRYLWGHIVSLRYVRQSLKDLLLTLAVVAEGHLCLAKPDGVLALRDAIEFLEVRLVNALQWMLGGAARRCAAAGRAAAGVAGVCLPGSESKAQWP